MSCEQISELGPALALDALDELERQAVEAHLERCPTCAGEVQELRQVAAHLALAVPQHELSPALGQRILAAAAADRAATETESEAARPLPRPAARLVSPSWLQRWSPVLSLGSLAAALIALLWAVSLQAQLGSAQRQLAQTSAQLADAGAQLERVRGSYTTVVRVLASPDVQVRELQPGEGAPNAEGKVWVDPNSGQGMMMARNLPPLPESQTYQVWLVNAQGRVSSGLLRPSDPGVYYVVLQAPGRLTDYQRLGVTLEPAGGSPGPTGPRVIVGEL